MLFFPYMDMRAWYTGIDDPPPLLYNRKGAVWQCPCFVLSPPLSWCPKTTKANPSPSCTRDGQNERLALCSRVVESESESESESEESDDFSRSRSRSRLSSRSRSRSREFVFAWSRSRSRSRMILLESKSKPELDGFPESEPELESEEKTPTPQPWSKLN